jgi:hypothetical protein
MSSVSWKNRLLSAVGGNTLKAIVCGYERGGTTLLVQILNNHPRIDSGFESGLLLAGQPKDFLTQTFSDFNGNMIQAGWGVRQEDLEYMVEENDWNQVYKRLRERSVLITDKRSLLIDKTPKYMLVLSDVLSRMEHVPCIVVVKEPKGVIYSWLKRHPDIDLSAIPEQLIQDCCNRYEAYARGYNLAKKAYPKRILKVDYEQLCLHPKLETKKVFDHVGLRFREKYLHFERKYEVYGNNISDQYLREYEGILASDVLARIDELTGDALGLLSS